MEQKRKKRKLRLKPWAFCLFFLFFFTILVICIIKIFLWYQDNQKIKDITINLEQTIKITEKNTTGELINPPEDKTNDYWDYIKIPFLEVDFTSLKQKNQDTIAFIHVENTNINYPIVQTDNNEYYLTHAFDQSKNEAGWVFMDYRNDLNNLMDNTIIYGHGRLDTTVFGSLKNTLTDQWQQNKENYVIKLSTPQENMIFQIFSIYTIKEESYYITTTFSNEKEKTEWLNIMQERNIAPIETTVDKNDKILTLSTCQNNNGGRIVVQAKLIRKEMR